MRVSSPLAVMSGLLLSMSAIEVNSQRENHPVCYQILDIWWELREAQKTRAAITELDNMCATYSGNPLACNDRSQRDQYTHVSQDTKDAPCTTVGAHNKRCIGNPCNHLNTGDCTLQRTQGQCRWFTRGEVTAINKYYKEQGIPLIPGAHGCYRNPCNMPGYGKLSDETCQAQGVPGVFDCTWCKGANDPKLKGKGMGCQTTIPTTTAECAPVNNADVKKSSIFWNINKKSCQCSNTYYLCEEVINEREPFRPRFPSLL